MHSPLLSPPWRSRAALSLVEVLITVGVIAVLSTLSVIAVNRVNENARDQKLVSDVRTVNSAITLYLANGGSLDTLSDPNGILTKLKSTRSKSEKERHVGAPSGRLIDSRVAAVVVPEASAKRRARFNTESALFEIFDEGAGVEFVLDESLAEVAATIETRSNDAVKYAATSTWVWDHAATVNPGAPQGPTKINTNPSVKDTVPTTGGSGGPPPGNGNGSGGSTPTPPPTPPGIPRLATPQFSLAGGAHPEDDFPLLVSITNLPAQGDPIYQLGNGAWLPYTGPVSVPMNTRLRAQFLTQDASLYQSSSQHSAHYYPVPDSLSGSVESDFHSPSGGPNLTYEITDSGDRFAHGDPVFLLDGEPVNSGDPNVLGFSSQAFSEIAPGQKFKLGAFFYHNGSTYYDSHANRVLLAVRISLPERGQTLAFNLNLDLVNTENDPDDANASADYVKITNLTQDVPLQINGVNYRIKLEFGATDSFGFSSQSQFHVYEGATGQGELLGTFLPR